ncbi:peptide chain release factor N(5)-glutamine methyltransferase [Pseudoponticoccus marisrubri]|uniref:Release factor glutamine methyltransferase n=1 Tax=Pseudoponticoccus marisrubri TaxID=1685382 RepID=A0A0W7WNR5_9RHOB|nr:peptide chain release factor N(5)-glutamine methyltransferase [Pseudoponticoccus marisrubri]KUF12148.1 protein-(glutamine-N5) methyltransferase, release factor-specific [Pseudoponticoccus marisrubri]
MRGTDLLMRVTARLTAAGLPDPGRDARRLLAHALGVAPGRLTLVLPEPVAPEVETRLEALVDRRAAHVPVSQLTGQRTFYGRSFRVTSDVLDPRPETEILIEAALAEPFASVLDLGTGSGNILLTLLAERGQAVGLGTDLSTAALSVARENAVALELQARAEFRQGDWYAALSEPDLRFDLVVSNPPYIARAEMAGLSRDVREHEPRMALTDEGDGLGAYRAILAGATGRLAPGGRLLLEIGPTQGAAVAGLCRAAGLEAVRVIADLDGRDRVVCARFSA